MSNPMFNPQPNYSGVTIQITNPAVYTGQCDGKNFPCISAGQIYANGNVQNPQGNYVNYPQEVYAVNPHNQFSSTVNTPKNITNPNQDSGYANAYPAQYYLNSYNYNGLPAVASGTNDSGVDTAKVNNISDNNVSREAEKVTNNYFEKTNNAQQEQYSSTEKQSENYNRTNAYQIYSDSQKQKDEDLTKSQNIIDDISQREAEIAEEKKNSKETKIVALTDEYIKSLENYLNNPNDEIRLMASKEILTRLDEDKDRYNDAALNALLNKMLQDPNKLVRIAALSAFGSQLACGNDYTVRLLQNIQSNPNADKEDVLQAADILLKMSAGVEVKRIPNPAVKETKQQ